MTLEEIESQIEATTEYTLEMQPPSRPTDKWGYCLYDGDYPAKWGGKRWKTELEAAEAALRWIERGE